MEKKQLVEQADYRTYRQALEELEPEERDQLRVELVSSSRAEIDELPDEEDDERKSRLQQFWAELLLEEGNESAAFEFARRVSRDNDIEAAKTVAKYFLHKATLTESLHGYPQLGLLSHRLEHDSAPPYFFLRSVRSTWDEQADRQQPCQRAQQVFSALAKLHARAASSAHRPESRIEACAYYLELCTELDRLGLAPPRAPLIAQEVLEAGPAEDILSELEGRGLHELTER